MNEVVDVVGTNHYVNHDDNYHNHHHHHPQQPDISSNSLHSTVSNQNSSIVTTASISSNGNSNRNNTNIQMPENCYVGARVMRNSSDWKWAKQVNNNFVNILIVENFCFQINNSKFHSL